MEMFYLIGFAWWLFLCGFVGATARERGEGFIAWFFLALLVSPPMAVLLMIATPIKKTA
jgi:hypothetical protein